jgi:tRNA-Thr(GGU) m(6)t(6)A37 methyltransferase TsaA
MTNRTAALDLRPVGYIRTPFRTLTDCPRHPWETRASARIEILPELADALLGIREASHLHVMYWLDQAARSPLLRPTPHDGATRGVFATRSPIRPNPIGLTVVKLLGLDGNSLEVGSLDCVDGTPLIDVKPYLPGMDSLPEATLSWFRP